MKHQTRQVLHLLRLRGADGLTPAEARTALACDRLAARVFELRREGFDIEAVSERTPAGARVARYVLRRAFRPVAGVQEGLSL